MASVTLKHIYKIYQGGVTAVSDFTLDIEDKEFIVLVGPSGCGKSTTLRMVAGLEEISEGELYIGDKLVNDVAPKDRDIAMVFQNYALYPHMTVYDNMAFGLKLRKTPKAEIEKRVREAAKILDIEHLLSRTEITKLHHRLQTTFIYVTHDQTEAMTMGSRIVVMKDGFIQQVDTPQNLYDYPGNQFVAGFIGSPQMNFFTVKLTKTGDGVYAVFGNNKVKIPAGKLQKFVSDSYIGKEVYMGIRPENIHDDAAFISNSPDSVIDVDVEVVELMGSETYLYLKTTGKDGNIVARVDPRSVSRTGDKIKVAFDVNRLHFFDKDTEATILTR